MVDQLREEIRTKLDELVADVLAKHVAFVLLLVSAAKLPAGRRSEAGIIAWVEELAEKADNNPCKSCGADPSRYPDTNEEVPIVKGALDEQAKAEAKFFEERQRADALRDALTSARRALADLHWGFHGGESARAVAVRLWGEDEAGLLFPEVPRG